MTPQSPNVSAAPFRRRTIHTPRLRLRPDSESSGYIDAAWWPRSSNLNMELRVLIPELQPRSGPLMRIVYDPAAWSPTDWQLIIIDERTIRLDPYPFALFGTMYMCGTDGTVIVLHAIPSGTDTILAQSVLAASGEPARSDSVRRRGEPVMNH